MFRWFLKRLPRPDPCDDRPSPPRSTVTIDGISLINLLRKYGIELSGGPGDAMYQLMTVKEAESFLAWYQDKHKYTWDDYDCDKFAWVMRAEAIKWMGGKYVWGYIEAEGRDSECSFPNHGFCFVVTDDYKVWFCDELEMAAPRDELNEAYEIKCHMAKA